MVESPSVSISFSQDLTAVQLPKDIAIGEVRMVRLKLSVPRSWKQYKMTNDPDAKTCCSWWSSEDSGDGDVLKWKWVQLTCLLMRNPIVELYVCISCRVICLILYFKQKYIYIYVWVCVICVCVHICSTLCSWLSSLVGRTPVFLWASHSVSSCFLFSGLGVSLMRLFKSVTWRHGGSCRAAEAHVEAPLNVHILYI